MEFMLLVICVLGVVCEVFDKLVICRVGPNRTRDFHILYIRHISVYTVYEGKWIHSEVIHRGVMQQLLKS